MDVTRIRGASADGSVDGPTAVRPRPTDPRILVLGCVGALVGVATVVAPYVSWYEGPIDVWRIAAEVTVGWSFVFLGLYMWWRRPENRVGRLSVAVGFAWFLFDLGWIPSDLTWTLGWLLSNVYVLLLAHLYLVFPSGRPDGRFARALIAGLYVWWAISTVTQGLLFDEGASSFHNVFALLSAAPFADAVGRFSSAVSAVLAVVVLATLVMRWVRGSSARRHALAPVVMSSIPTGVVALLLFAGQALGAEGLADAANGSVALFVGVALPIGFAVGLFRSRLVRSSVGELVIELGGSEMPRGGLRDALAQRLSDPTLEIAYVVPGATGYVDAEGRPLVLPGKGSGRAVTMLERDAEPIAALIHDDVLRHDPEIVEAVAAAARLAIWNERLRAEIRANLEDVRASRARIVEAGDAERRRVERNLHDGAQQRLVSLSLALAMMRERIGSDGDPSLADAVDAAADELKTAIAELRELAQGIHPAVLTEQGLGAAVAALAERAPMSVDIDDRVRARASETVEATAYFVVAEALTNIAKHAGATRADVVIEQRGHALHVTISDDGVGGADATRGSGLRGMEDRVAALGGTLAITSQTGAGSTVRAVIPLGDR